MGGWARQLTLNLIIYHRRLLDGLLQRTLQMQLEEGLVENNNW